MTDLDEQEEYRWKRGIADVNTFKGNTFKENAEKRSSPRRNIQAKRQITLLATKRRSTYTYR